MPVNYEQAISIAVDRMRRARGKIERIHIVEVGEDEYILCTDLFLPQLSSEYEHFRVAKTIVIRKPGE